MSNDIYQLTSRIIFYGYTFTLFYIQFVDFVTYSVTVLEDTVSEKLFLSFSSQQTLLSKYSPLQDILRLFSFHLRLFQGTIK